MRSFRTLVRHFFGRFFDKESLSPQGEMETSVVQVLALLAVPGMMSAMYLLPRVGLAGWPLAVERYYHVAWSMIVMGFVMVFEWDALFPDRRDYLILTPLPLRSPAVLAAKTAALAIFLGLFALDVNFFGTLLLPLVAGGPTWSGSALGHLIATVSGALFMALAAAALQGVLALTLNARMFRRVSAIMQAALMGALVMALFVSLPVAAMLRRLVETNHPALYWFPFFWFAGLYEYIEPTLTSATVLPDLALRAAEALAVAAGVFAATYLAAFRRHARGAAESLELRPSGPSWVRLRISGFLDRRVLKHPVERAAFHFTGETIARSLKHRLFLAAYSGFGIALALTSLASGRSGLLPLPLTLSFFLVSGLRAAFSFPSELGANWVFQTTESACLPRYLAATRKWIVICGILPLFLLMAPVEFAVFAWPAALFHLAFGITLSVLLMQVMFFGFRKVPFTCSYFPGKANLIGLLVLYLYGFTTYSYTMAELESALLNRPVAAAAFFGAAALACRILGRWRDRQNLVLCRLEYEDAPDPIVRTLGLGTTAGS